MVVGTLRVPSKRERVTVHQINGMNHGACFLGIPRSVPTAIHHYDPDITLSKTHQLANYKTK